MLAFQMDLGTYLEENPEYEYDDVRTRNKAVENKPHMSELSKRRKDRKSTPVRKSSPERGKQATKGSKGGSKPDNLYEIPNVYAEIPHSNYESLQPEQRNTKRPGPIPRQPSTPKPRPAQPRQQRQTCCCGRSTRFWCLLTTVLLMIIVILLVVFLTGTDLNYINVVVS